jgi:hypothetical protein
MCKRGVRRIFREGHLSSISQEDKVGKVNIQSTTCADLQYAVAVEKRFLKPSSTSGYSEVDKRNKEGEIDS